MKEEMRTEAIEVIVSSVEKFSGKYDLAVSQAFARNVARQTLCVGMPMRSGVLKDELVHACAGKNCERNHGQEICSQLALLHRPGLHTCHCGFLASCTCEIVAV